MNRKKFLSLITGVNLIVIIVIINVLLALFPIGRIDLSKDRVHSLSPASKKIVTEVNDIVNIKVFLTTDLPSEVKPVSENLKIIVQEIANLNKNKIRVSFLDPSKNEDVKEEAEKLGIQPLQFSSLKSDKFEIQTGYFGLALMYGDKKEVLPVAGDVGNLEYLLVSAIKKLTSSKESVVALAIENTAAYQYLEKFLEQNYKVSIAAIDGDTKLPEEAESLIIVGRSKKIDDKGITKIKEWVKNGKGLIVFLDKVIVNQNMAAKKIEDTGLEAVLKEYGMEIESKLLADENATIASFRTSSGTFMTQYPYWPLIRAENINGQLPVTSGINSLSFAWVSPIKLSGGAKSLADTSKNSFIDDSFTNLVPVSNKQFDKETAGQHTVAAINTEGIKVATIADSDFIADEFVVNSQQNMSLALNLVDYFSSDASLLEIRSKNLTSKPLMTISDRGRMAIKAVGVMAPIVILLVSGAVIVFLRVRKNKKW